MRFLEIERLSPNCSVTPVHEQLGVLFHHSVMSFGQTITFMGDPASQVSYHCLVAPDGTRCMMVQDQHIAWHAGGSSFMGRTRCNDFLLGLSFAGDTYATPLTDAQLDSAMEWLARRWAIRQWTLDRMVDHRQVSAGRKDDLNPIEWDRLRTRISAYFS
jgi:AmpD protein